MKTLDLTKYGFVRRPEFDYRGGGYAYKIYSAGKITRVAVARKRGANECYVSTEAPYLYNDYTNQFTMPQTIIKDFDSYKNYFKYSAPNDITIWYDAVDDQALYNLYNICLAFEQDYISEVENIMSQINISKKDIDYLMKTESEFRQKTKEQTEKFIQEKLGKLILDNKNDKNAVRTMIELLLRNVNCQRNYFDIWKDDDDLQTLKQKYYYFFKTAPLSEAVEIIKNRVKQENNIAQLKALYNITLD